MRNRTRLVVAASAVAASICTARFSRAEKMQVGFLWHMHQPIYYPGENIIQTDQNQRYSFSVVDVHNQRFGPYTTWPRDAIQSGLSLPNLGAQVSFSGSLMENLNALQAAGVNGGMWNNWTAGYKQARAWNTQQNNTRLDLVGFNYNHALMPLLDVRDMRMQIQMHKYMTQQTFGSNVPYSAGFFPAETAFSERMIPALAAEGFNWTLVDNIHFDRATKNYPHTNSSGLYAPNKADQINPDPAQSGGAWIQLNNVWAPSKVSAPFSYRPHNVQYVDPNTGAVSKITAVPGARYEGNEDGRGGFGALQYQTVMDQYRQYNTDPAHPMFVMLHHDGDNYGGGSDSYYHNNFQSMVNWANGNANYNVSTVADYLTRFPVATNDVIHVENGSWAGADNGDPEFKKWVGDPNGSGWSPDRNSWAVLTAAKNRVFTAEDITPVSGIQNVINGTGNSTDKAWHFLAQSEASDHWYWDGTQPWDSNVTRGCNLAVQHANAVISGFTGSEHTPPTVFVPQRDSYNPGAYEFNSTAEPSDFKVWTYAYDVSGMQSVTLKWRSDVDGENPLISTQNETYSGGSEVTGWTNVNMTSSDVVPPGNILAPTYRALQYAGMITGQQNKLIDYYVEAVDANGNITRSDIQHVWVGNSTGGGDSGFTLDGALDSGVTEVASHNGMHLYFGRKGSKIYLATNDAGEGNDHFIYLARSPGAMVPANWAKAGQVAQWDAYLADENNNTYSGWFDAQGASQSATGANGGVLEGTLDLLGEFGFIPSVLYLAVGVYQTADGGQLLYTYQVPGSLDNDINLQANEYLQLQVAQGWVGVTSNNWSVATNWTDASIPNSAGAHAQFLNGIATPGTVTVDVPVTVGRITLDNTLGYTLAGSNALTMDVPSGSATISVVSGNHTISAPLIVNDNLAVNVQRAQDTLTVSNLQTTGSTIAKDGAGALSVNRIRAAGLSVSAGTVQIMSNGTDAGASRVGVLNLGGANPIATLDLADNDLVVTASSYVSIAGAVVHARHSGAWDQTGITSSAARTTTGQSRTLGVMTGQEFTGIYGPAATFDGFNIAAGDVLVKFTWYGDSDFNGSVDFDDYVRIDGGYNSGADGWVNGDFDLSGGVDFDDYVLIDLGFNAQSGTLRRAVLWLSGEDRSDYDTGSTALRLVKVHFAEFGNAYATHFLTAVPEPGNIVAIAAGLWCATARQRRNPRQESQ